MLSVQLDVLEVILRFDNNDQQPIVSKNSVFLLSFESKSILKSRFIKICEFRGKWSAAYDAMELDIFIHHVGR